MGCMWPRWWIHANTDVVALVPNDLPLALIFLILVMKILTEDTGYWILFSKVRGGIRTWTTYFGRPQRDFVKLHIYFRVSWKEFWIISTNAWECFGGNKLACACAGRGQTEGPFHAKITRPKRQKEEDTSHMFKVSWRLGNRAPLWRDSGIGRAEAVGGHSRGKAGMLSLCFFPSELCRVSPRQL